ncbi:uncharacterized protein LOC129798122 isoform X1 [Phlebotomus papatasi]|uniref:uncharacterized protein LOC129798122 isoform X1 n=1 Tax=Phlebotomus papatasi TaxID=29031 RepID=UPI00248415BB|nr:uncharacterized protein LOC129798122 isoform X1 [Phlebotomus papatasi]
MSCNRSFCFLLRCGQTTRLLSQNCSKSSLGGTHSKFLGNLMQIPRNCVVRRWTGSYATGNLSADEANEFVDNLSAEERENLKNALAQYDSSTRRKFEGPQLGTARWRSGRMRRISQDATGRSGDEVGSHCKLPDEYLEKKLAEVKSPPTSSQKLQLFLVNGLPFIGFGFLDNFMMIVCGDYIEQTLGGYMCLSTMAAAGLGNTISDVVGLGSAVYVERLCEVMGFKVPPLSKFQMEMKESRRSASFGRILGITIGCLIGMFPLLFIDTEKKKEDGKADGKTH